MNALFNGTTLLKGGALQVAVAFIEQALRCDAGVKWHFALSAEVVRELEAANLLITDSDLHTFHKSPAKSLRARRQLLELECDGGFDAILTLFGPAYVKFKAQHLCGVADPWVTHSNLLAFRSLGSTGRAIQYAMLMGYKAFWYRKANAWIVEAQNARQGLISRLKLKPELIYVVPNTCGEGYRKQKTEMKLPKEGEKVRLLCLSAYYDHKNLGIIPEVARHVRALFSGLDFEFVITLPDDCEGYQKIARKAADLGVGDCINNIGPVAVDKGPDVYKRCHIAFLPSLLETFSANYPEAMAMQRPIVTTDLGFARDVCKNAALYFEPRNALSAAECILKLINDQMLWNRLVVSGNKVLGGLPTPKEKYLKYVDIVQSLNVVTATL